ncbi:MAG: VWA domain-containing protein [Victivallales bacterium]|nr:VWA domain-containing protein [Victivallales bacterium]
MPDELEILGDSASSASEGSSSGAETTPNAATTSSSAPSGDIPESPDNNANKTYKNAGVVDLVFLIDVTGSMGPCINALRENINHFIDMLTSTVGNGSPVTDWRARVVGYRDYPYDGQTSYGWLVDNTFTRDALTLKNQLAALSPKGGGPGEEGIPESLLDAMMVVATSGKIDLQAGDDEADSKKWRPDGDAARIVIIFTDATYHPTMSIPGYEGAGVRDLYNVYNQEHIKPYFFVPSDASYAILGRFKGAMLTQCGEGSDGLVSVTSDQAKFNELLERLAKGVSQSASAGVRVTL